MIWGTCANFLSFLKEGDFHQNIFKKRKKMFNREPHSYTRFNLTQNMEGDNSQVEMKLSSEIDEEVGGNGVGEHFNHNSNSSHKPYVAQKFGCTPKKLCFMAVAILLIFIGYLFGYLVHRKNDMAPNCAASVPPVEQPIAHETGAAPLMDWDDVKKLLAQKLTPAKFEPVFRVFSSDNHRAGSPGDDALGNKVLKKFREYSMNPWADEYFVKVQDAPISGSNRVAFKDGTVELSGGFLSYSATGTVTGAVLYAYYGEEENFRTLRDKNIDPSGRVILVRAGKISFAEKVANAAKMNASAVLIYPDPTDYPIQPTTALFGHVHLGSGDPYTPGFPSFNHTQFPPVQNSGLPKILAQTITWSMASKILVNLGGQSVPETWGGMNRHGDTNDNVIVEVNNVLAEKKINNVFGVIKGFADSDRYVVIGAQRDAWGKGFAASTVGTSILIELARSISEMVKNDGFKPRRSIVFASWSAGEYGSIGATEWLEGYLSSLSMKACSYISLDGVVAGQSKFKVAASPLMHSLIESTMKEVATPVYKSETLFAQFGKGNWESNVLEPLKLDNAAYAFLAFAGIPSVSFRFTSGNSDYPYFGTLLDTRENLNGATSNQVTQLAEIATRFTGHMVLSRLVYDHLLRMDVLKYGKIIRVHVAQINSKVKIIRRLKPQMLPEALTLQWMSSASGSYYRAARGLEEVIQNSDLDDIEMCRIINDRIMMVERNWISPYVSPIENPFRHILLGSGPHTLKYLSTHLEALRTGSPEADVDLFRNQLALATWTIEGCANSLAGDIWSLDNEI